MKRHLVLLLAALLLTACAPSPSSGEFDARREITVISREAGSGTRGAFTELTGVQEKTEDRTIDRTTLEAGIANSTGVVMGGVANDRYAIGYISLGSLGGSVKPLALDGAAPTAENVRGGSYTLARPFILVTNGAPTGLAGDFIDFILSAEGQGVLEGRGYISAVPEAPAFAGSLPGGTIVISGSTSVAPGVEQLAEAYRALNPGAHIEVHSQGSTAGIHAAIEGIADIGMSSRELNESELAQLNRIVIAIDGLVLIVNNANPLDGLSTEEARDIFTGEITRWSQLIIDN